MSRKPVARVGDSGSHGGGIITGSSKIPVNNRALARVGDIYSCPTHGPNPIGTGAPHVLGQGKLVAHVGSRTACGATITSGSPDTFVEIPSGLPFEAALAELLHETTYVEFQLFDENEKPIPDEAYIITYPTGIEVNGTLDDNGFVHLDDVPRGQCLIRFPDLEVFEEED